MLRRILVIALGIALISILSLKDIKNRNYASTVVSANPTQSCNPRDNMNETADSFIGRCCKGSIRSVFPGEYLNKTMNEIQQNCKVGSRRDCEDGDEPTLDSAQKARTAWKLLTRSEYRK